MLLSGIQALPAGFPPKACGNDEFEGAARVLNLRRRKLLTGFNVQLTRAVPVICQNRAMRNLIPIILGCLLIPVAASATPAFTSEIQGFVPDYQHDYSTKLLNQGTFAEPFARNQDLLASAAQPQLLDTLLSRARSQLNSMYHFGGTTPEQGFDCSGFVGWIYHGVLRTELPRVADAIFKIDAPRISATQLAPGDLMFYRITGSRVSHVTMYVGDRHFIHATRAGQPLRIESMDMPYWRQRFAGAKRILGTPLLKAQYQAQYQVNN